MARIKVKITINDKAAMEKLGDVLERKMTGAAMFIEGDVVRRISRGQATRRLKSGRLIGLDPSQEGESPKVLYGRLKQSITHKVIRKKFIIRAQIGTNVKYARRLELGYLGLDKIGRLISQGPRPFLRPGLMENKSKIARLIKVL